MTDTSPMRPPRPHELPDRRESVTQEWQADLAGSVQKLRFTYSFDEAGRVRECFCAGFRVGSDLERDANAICIGISHQLQFGSTIGSLARAYRHRGRTTQHALAREVILCGVSVEREARAGRATA